ncbi:MAG: DedA family protein [Bacillota bacterium]
MGELDIKEYILYIVSTYKYAGLYTLFVIDTMGVFLPSKTILTISGIMVEQSFLRPAPLFFSAFLGSLTGFSLGYTIGLKLGKPFILKYGRYVFITGEKLHRAESFFNKYGPGFIIVAYFIPGVRHVTPYLSGITGMSFTRTLTFASIGAALWITTFVSLGRYVGERLPQISNFFAGRWEFILSAVILTAVLITVFLALRKKRG